MKAVMYETELGWVVKTDTKTSTFATKDEATSDCVSNGVDVEDLSLIDHGTKKKRKKRDKK